MNFKTKTMARELVLVPKSKYEHLLKVAKQPEENEQSGGQLGSTEEYTQSPNIKPKNNISDENESASENKYENEKNTESEEKPKLYVDRPLSEMPFDSTRGIASRSKKAKRVKKSPRKRKLARSSGTKRRTNSRWINYII